MSALCPDQDGTLWVGTDTRLLNLRGGRFIPQAIPSEKPGPAIWSLLQTRDGTLWIGTNSSGLLRFKNGKFRAITTRDGLYNDVAFQILDDNLGFLWMSCNKGISRTSKKELNDFADGRIQRVNSLSFGIPEGVRGIESTGPAQPAGCRAQDGKLWFPSIKGVAVVDLEYNRYNNLIPPVAIEKMTVDGQGMSMAPPLAFAPGRKRLEFTYTVLSFLVPEKVRFRTWLQGFDRSWSTETNQRQVSYTNLPPGRYTLRVIACNNDGKWNESGARLVFELRPFFYQTLWFQLLAVLALLLLAVLAVRWRFRSLERHKYELEAQVRERTAQLSRVNEELLQANRVQDEMQRIAVHDLKNPLQTIMGSADLIYRQNPEFLAVVRLAERISKASKRMMTLVNEMLEISRIETGDIKLELQAVDIGVLISLAAEGFANQMLNKEQKLEFKIEAGCLVRGDPEWLKVIFENLISNAVKFSPCQASITVAVNCRGEMVLVTVKDHGPGLTAEDKKKLFGKFQRLSARPTGGESSTGLGLSIAEQLVRRHNGRIWAESELGQGSVFFVELPRSE